MPLSQQHLTQLNSTGRSLTSAALILKHWWEGGVDEAGNVLAGGITVEIPAPWEARGVGRINISSADSAFENGPPEASRPGYEG